MRVALVALALISFANVAWGVKKKPPVKAKAKVVAKATAVAAPKVAKVDRPEVLFTFDDGPAFGQTIRVLDLLDQYKIKAVFFVNGVHFLGKSASAEKEREILRETKKRGHYVGNHTVHHYFLCGKVYSLRAAQEIEENAALIEDAVGQRPELFRTPFGAHCPTLNATLASLGIKPIYWDIDPQDWKVKNAAVIEQRVTSSLRTLRGRAILLLHDVQGETVKALPNILAWLDKENQARAKDGRPVIQILDYSYLLPEHKLVPPLLDTLGRVLLRTLAPAGLDMRSSPLMLWPRLAWMPGRV